MLVAVTGVGTVLRREAATTREPAPVRGRQAGRLQASADGAY
jgi:hypothetical protein